MTHAGPIRSDLFRPVRIPKNPTGCIFGADYEQFFQCIMKEDDFNPESILTDFEAATIKAINSLFPRVSHKGNMITFFKIII